MIFSKGYTVGYEFSYVFKGNIKGEVTVGWNRRKRLQRWLLVIGYFNGFCSALLLYLSLGCFGHVSGRNWHQADWLWAMGVSIVEELLVGLTPWSYFSRGSGGRWVHPSGVLFVELVEWCSGLKPATKCVGSGDSEEGFQCRLSIVPS